MKKLYLSKWLGLTVTVLAMAVGPVAAPASAQTGVVVEDPIGDVKFHAPAFQDIVRGEIEKDGDNFILRMQVAGPITPGPRLPPPGNSEIWWIWSLNLDPNTYPDGYPFPPGEGLSVPAEVMVYVGWDGATFWGRAIDRRPLLTGQDAIITPVRFSIDGASVTAVLASPSDLPANFGWGTRTMDWSAPPGIAKASFHIVDIGGLYFNPFP